MTVSEQSPAYSRKISQSDEAGGTRNSVKNMIDKLSSIPEEDWRYILFKYGHKVEGYLSLKKAFRIGLRVGLITKDLGTLKSNLRIMNRNDLLQKLPEEPDTLSGVSDTEFRKIFKSETLGEDKLEQWKKVLKRHIIYQNTSVEPILGQGMKEISDIYIPLTVIEQDSYRKVLERPETNSELELLAKYGSKQKGEDCEQQCNENKQHIENNTLMCQFERRNLIEVLCCRNTSMPTKVNQEKSLCLTGNPGSGKTFLSTKIALLYGKSELDQFDFCLSIPCRDPEWHQLEQTRENSVNTIDEKLVLSWLKLGMNPNFKWSEDLSEQLFNNDGEGLLLIIDSVDEFTKEVPFNQTILSSLLHRKILSKSTIILTSRPGVWFDITSENSDILIESQFHVLGFSPTNRDIFFRNTLKDESKINECYELFHYHYEIALLSLIPVNASFFAHLFNSDASKLSYTLTKLFSSLVLYLIRRQLSRMKLESYIKVENLHELDKNILDCLYEIGEVAYSGVASRDLRFTKMIPLELGGRKFNSDWLGLVNVQIKLDPSGKEIKEWSFSHLTMQEYVSAQWLSSIKWFEICLITRYVVSSTETFSTFKMVLRFVCGILGPDAQNTIYIAFKYYLIKPVEFKLLSQFQQLCYQDTTSQSDGIFDKNDNFFKSSDLEAFTKQFLSMISLVVEADSETLKQGQRPPKDPSLYIRSKIEPSEWLNFTKSMKYLEKIHLLYFITDFLTCEEFELFLKNIKYCELEYLAIKFKEKDYNKIMPYIEILNKFEIPTTKVCFDLIKCDLSNSNQSAMVNLWDKISINSLRLLNNNMSVLEHFSSHLISLKNVYFSPKNSETYTNLEPLLENTKLQGLHLFKIPEYYFQRLFSAIPSFTCLEEVSLHSNKAHSILPILISSCSKLTHLSICSDSKSDQDYSEDLLQLIMKHENSLKTLQLFSLDKIGHKNLNSIFDSLQSCHNLVRLHLEDCDITFDTDSLSELKMPENLICLEVINVSLTDAGLKVLIRMFPFHKTLRYIKIIDCILTSNSCERLRNLVYTLKRLKEFEVSDELSKPDDEPIKILRKVVESLSANFTPPALVR